MPWKEYSASLTITSRKRHLLPLSLAYLTMALLRNESLVTRTPSWPTSPCSLPAAPPPRLSNLSARRLPRKTHAVSSISRNTDTQFVVTSTWHSSTHVLGRYHCQYVRERPPQQVSSSLYYPLHFLCPSPFGSPSTSPR